MSALLKIVPSSASLHDSRNVSFELFDLPQGYETRVSFENITFSSDCPIIESSGRLSDRYIHVDSGVTELTGSIDLNFPPDADASVASILASVEQFKAGEWRLTDIAAFAFQLKREVGYLSADKIAISPPFVGPEDTFRIDIESDPDIKVKVSISGRTFLVRTDASGKGSMSVAGIDLLSGASFSSKSIVQLPVTFSKSNENYSKIYDSGSSLHYVPEKMHALQATNNTKNPECAIIDEDPLPGVTLRTLDDFCFEGAVVGDLSIFDSSSGFENSRSGICSDIQRMDFSPSQPDSVCRIHNSLDSALMPDGSALAVFASSERTADEMPILSSRVFIAQTSTSLKFSGNPVRTGTILKPKKFYHSFRYGDVMGSEGFVGIVFRLSNGEVTEIRYNFSEDEGDVLETLLSKFESSSLLSQSGIDAFISFGVLNFVSDNRFSIRSNSSEGISATAVLNSNATLDILLSDDFAFDDIGSTLVFLSPQLGSQSYAIADKQRSNIIRISMPDGVNNGVGPLVTDNLYCQQFVIVSSSEPNNSGISSLNPLPYILDEFRREIPATNPVIAIPKERIEGSTYAYIVAQAPVNGVYQLFLYSLSADGEQGNSPEWTQLTFTGENKNPVIECDSIGNLHILWESDRSGISTQIYYSVLGPSSRVISNQVLVSSAEKNREFSSDLFNFRSPVAYQNGWTRFLSGSGGVSVSNDFTLAVDGNSVKDNALAVYKLSADQDDEPFDGLFSQLSYQVSFDLSLETIGHELFSVLSDADIRERFLDFKSQFIPLTNNRYQKDNNIFTLNREDLFFGGLIPIAGSYKFGNFSASAGGRDARGLTHAQANEFVDFSDEFIVSNADSNLYHYMIALIPEKYRFKASNIDPLFLYLEKNELDESQADTYIPQIEEEVYTGRFKFALVLATSENTETGDASAKKYHLIRQFGDVFDFNESKNLKIAVHYSKANSDVIDGLISTNPYIEEQDIRYFGDILVSLDDKIQLGETFVADFSDQYRAFDVGLGFFGKGSFSTREQMPFDGNTFENLPVILTYDNIAIGPHSVQPNEAYYSFSVNDRSTSQMVSSEQFIDSILNGDFESNALPVQTSTELNFNDNSISSWSIGNQVTVHYFDGQNGIQPFSGRYSVELTGSDDVNLGSLEQSFATDSGKLYHVIFALSSHPLASIFRGESVTRKVRITVDGVSSDFETTIEQGETGVNWTEHRLSFTATSSSATVRIENISDSQSPFFEYGPIVDAIRVFDANLLPDEFVSQSASQESRVSPEQYRLLFSLNRFSNISAIPITFSFDDQNRNPDIAIDRMNKVHACWQSNHLGYWNIVYSGSRFRMSPFKFETLITNTDSNSIEPSIAANSSGKRVIAWHDDRAGRYYQVYSAVNKIDDPMSVNQCHLDEVGEYIYRSIEQLDPYDPYDPIGTLSCEASFSFKPDVSGSYFFVLNFFSDRDKTNLVASIDSRDSILGWKVNGQQLSAQGLQATAGSDYTIQFDTSEEDRLGDAILYVDAIFESAEDQADLVVSTTGVTETIPPFGTNLEAGAYSSNDFVFFRESLRPARSAQAPQSSADLSSLIGANVSPTLNILGQGVLPGFAEGDEVASYFIQLDTADNQDATKSLSITFSGNILAIYFDKDKLLETHEDFGRNDIRYSVRQDAGMMDSNEDSITISSDRKTIEVTMSTNTFAIDNLRVIVDPLAEIRGETPFVFHCPYEQSPRCSVETDYFNGTDIQQDNMHFRVTFFADSEMKSAVLSSFTKFDINNWIYQEEGFPASGATVGINQRISIGYDPDVLPFEKYRDQGGQPTKLTLTDFFGFGFSDWKIEQSSIRSEALWTEKQLSHEYSSSSDDYFVGSSKFSGDFSAYYGGKVKLGIRLDTAFSSTTPADNLHVDFESSMGTLRYSASKAPNRSNQAEVFEFYLQPGASWGYEPSVGGGFSQPTIQQMQSVLADVENIKVLANFGGGQDRSYLNSFSISGPLNQYDTVFAKPLVCGVNYFYRIERFYEGVFTTIKEGSYICGCSDTDSNIWREDSDSPLWKCSGQGFDDIRISQTDREAIHPKVVSATNGLFYISWEDYRFARVADDQPAVSPSLFFGLYNANEDRFYSSAQGSFDRRINGYDGTLYFDSSPFIDHFQNFNIVYHSQDDVFHQACSLGCIYERVLPDSASPCLFTDGTGDGFYSVSIGPDRDIQQYQKMRIRRDYVAYSTYKDFDTPVPVVNDCFIELDIVGVPGTYAYRLKNEVDDQFTEWLPINADLPGQPTDDENTNSERDFFRAYFIGRDRFIAPWIASSGNGSKRVCCEILTYFGKTEQFCFEFEAIYEELKHSIDFFYDEALSKPVPKFKGYPVFGTKEAPSVIDENNLQSITEDVANQNPRTIYIRVEFENKEKLRLYERMQEIDRFNLENEITFSFYQQGLYDQIGLPLTKVSEGVYTGSFKIEESDSVVNVDGLSMVTVSVPGQCNPFGTDNIAERFANLLNPKGLEQKIRIQDNKPIFLEAYNADDTRNSFGDPKYYNRTRFKREREGKGDFGEAGGNSQWPGGGAGPI